MDSTKLYFLPEDLRVPLHAEFQSYDLMSRGYSFDMLKVTLTIIMVAIICEVVRKALRLFIASHQKYSEVSNINSDTDLMAAMPRPAHSYPALASAKSQDPNEVAKQQSKTKVERIKAAIRLSFQDNKDHFMKFIVFTTVLIFAFIFFPRLKLLSMAVASITALGLDLFNTKRLTFSESDDLVNRALNKVFRL